MKTKLYLLALLALFTCGLCLALPSVRHAAAELFTTAVARVSSPADPIRPTAKAALVKAGSGLSSVTITPISTGQNAERCAMLTTP